MTAINLVSNRPGAGKTCLAGALAVRCSEAGKRMAYYKPMSHSSEADQDIAFLRALLEGLGTSQDGVPGPFPQPDFSAGSPTVLPDSRSAQVEDNIAALEAGFDLALVDWSAPVAPQGRPLLLVYGCLGEETATSLEKNVTDTASRYMDDLVGIVLNCSPRHRDREISEGAVKALEERGLPVLGAIPEDREMLALTLQQVADFLEGRWVQEPVDSELWVDRFLIGGNILDSGPNYLGRYRNQAVITRAARPDIQLASLMCDTKLLVLTGGEDPTEYIRVEAHKRDAGLLLVPGDTLKTAEALGGLLDLANPYSRHKLARFTELADRFLPGGLDAILNQMAAGG